MVELKKHSSIAWNVIDKMFEDNPNHLIQHHITSFNTLFTHRIQDIFNDNNPIRIHKKYDKTTKEYGLKCNLYFGGKEGTKIYYGKPTLHDNDEDNNHLMYPNEARLKNKTYGFNIYYDIDVAISIKKPDGTQENESFTLDKICLGKFPIMVQSNFCLLNTMPAVNRFYMGECINDRGGYFIIDGKEKVIVCQEQFANNTINVKDDYDDIYSHSCDIRSVSEDSSKPVRVTSVRMLRPTSKWSNGNIVVLIPNVRKPIPLFIVFRALGVLSDKNILEFCLLNLEKNSAYHELFIPSIHDANYIFTQDNALKFIATFTKHKTIPSVMDILTNYFLPHIGELHFKQKALFIGHMVFKLLKLYTKVEPPTDRDSFRYKRIETPGLLLYNLFREYYQQMLKNITLRFDNEFYYKENSDIYNDANFPNLIKQNYKTFFLESGFSVQVGFKNAFKGQWGSKEYTTKEGIVQDLNRLSFNSALSHCRKINLPIDPTAKVVAPRLLHSSQWGFIDPVDTPDGGHIGLHKHLAVSTIISDSIPLHRMVYWLKKHNLILLTHCTLLQCDFYTKIFINGSWVGVHMNPFELIDVFNIYKRSGLIPLLVTITFNKAENIIDIFCDGGRLVRPVFFIEAGKPSYAYQLNDKDFMDLSKLSWLKLTSGFMKKNIDAINYSFFFDVEDLYGDKVSLNELLKNQGVLDFIDSSITNNTLITLHDFDNLHKYTHIEIHPSLMFGVMGNQIIYPNQNPVSRDLFSCGQSKQAVSLYSSNYQFRMDKMGVVLNYGQTPIVKSKYLKYINNEQHPYGENIIVAIMSYNGYNVEDSILFNQGSVERGLFRTTYFTSYEDHEETTASSSSATKNQTLFSNIENIENIEGTFTGFEYHHLDDEGIIKPETVMHDKIIILGKTSTDGTRYLDQSVKTKKGQLGIVDKTFISNDENGNRLAKVRIREERIPAIGDKFCSRCGQKGTIGLLIPEENMPFSDSGLKPDIIINPHAIPSRMTIGQLIETITGKASLINGSFANCTAFENTNLDSYSKVLSINGFHSQGNEVLYDGLSGNQISADIFIGPTYYMRLKHMVKDKINHRAGGPRNKLTRQTVQGRANDGGLRIGEMERDALVCHGIMSFLKSSMVDRGDKYYMAICNHSGTIAIHNKKKNTFFSPYIDGPIVFPEISTISSITGSKNTDVTDSNSDPSQVLNNIQSIAYATKFGKSFSIVQVPYALKLLIQELATLNIQMRIITSDNIDTLTTKHANSQEIPIKKILPDDLVTNAAATNTSDSNETGEIYDEETNTIVQHNIFAVNDTVFYKGDDNTNSWIIKEIDNSKNSDNIKIFTTITNSSKLPAGTKIEEIFDKSSQTTYKYATITVSINDISKNAMNFNNKIQPTNRFTPDTAAASVSTKTPLIPPKETEPVPNPPEQMEMEKNDEPTGDSDPSKPPSEEDTTPKPDFETKKIKLDL